MFNDDLKRRVKDATDIVDVIQSSIGKLVRAGRNWKACCPFHNEKTPSFNVKVDTQSFKCFGCGKAGDVFAFIMLIQRCEFPEALKILADRAGIRVEAPDPRMIEQQQREKAWKSDLKKLNAAAAEFYREQLFSPAGKHALAYLEKRGLNAEICERFDLGYAPSGGSPLLNSLTKRKVPQSALLAAGLATQFEGGGVGDFFRDRLMFPIRDIEGQVIAFGGRILGDGQPKYLNTRETPLFSKTKTVYGIDHARSKIVETRKAILVEGYTDVMMCHQFGITNVVACLGTAITSDHIRHLRRVADELVMLTDNDKAGADASERSLIVLMQEEMAAKIVRLPGEGKDPCDFLLAQGHDAFVEALTHTTELFEYKFERVTNAPDIATPLGIKKAAQELMRLISLVPDSLLKNEYRRRVSVRLNISERELEYEAKRNGAPVATSSSNESGAEEYAVGDVPPPENDLARAERELLKFLFHEPEFLADAVTELNFTMMSGRFERALGQAILTALNEGTLPPDPALVTEDGFACLVAREVLKKLDDLPGGGVQAADGIDRITYAKQVCIDLADAGTSAKGLKLDASSRFKMLIKVVKVTQKKLQLDDANRRMMVARLKGATEVEEAAYLEAIELRKEIKRLTVS